MFQRSICFISKFTQRLESARGHFVYRFIILILAGLPAYAQEVSTHSQEVPLSEFRPSLYVGLIAGVGDYSGTEQVKGLTAYGFLLGRKISPRWNFEMSFVQSKYEVLESRCSSNICSGFSDPIEMYLTQRNITLLGKHLLSTSSIRPFLGVGVSYVVREYDNRRSYYLAGREVASVEASRNFQLHLTAGAEAQLTNSVLLAANIGLLAPITNQSSESSDQLSGKLYDVDRSIEELSHYLFSLSGILVF